MRYANSFTVCPYCGTGCGLYLQTLDGELVGVRPVPSHPVSQGKLCIKGWQAHEFVTSKERLTKPLVRKTKTGKLQEASWDEALGVVAAQLRAVGPEHVAVLASAKCTNEENYLLQKFARVALKTNSVDHCARL
jgi:predicted molibdopterin-dependent oxidoreductase YjgC